MASRVASLPQVAGCGCGPRTRAISRPVAGGSLDPRSRAASALRMSRREMLGKRQVAAPLIAQRAAHGALRPAHRRFQPGQGVGVQLAGLWLSGKPQRPSPRQFGHKTLVPGFALIAPAASRPGQHCAVRRQRGRQVAPRGHASTVGQRFPRLVLRDDQQERQNIQSGTGWANPARMAAAHVTAAVRAPPPSPSATLCNNPASPGLARRGCIGRLNEHSPGPGEFKRIAGVGAWMDRPVGGK